MLDFLASSASVVISFIIVVGFIAIAAFLLFEIGTVLVFWIRHSWRGGSGGDGAISGGRKGRQMGL